MFRPLLLLLLAFALSSCILLVEEEPQRPVQPVQPVTPATPVQPGVVTPGPGSFTYRCSGGTLVVNYLDSNNLRLFYDGAFQNLSLVRRSPTLLFSGGAGGAYTWEWTGSRGTLTVRGQVVLSNCAL
jgi:membrane-bound inhibitor of C-type lysozyme